MPKTDSSFDANEYAPVAARITYFYDRFPTGRIVTKLISRVDRGDGVQEVTVRALVYRTADDARAAATGYASEREDDGDINAVACIENTETSAIGRALANLGFTASLRRPSREEMQKAERARMRLANDPPVARPSPTEKPTLKVDEALQERADHILGILSLLDEAERAGLPSQKTQALRARLMSPDATPLQVEKMERQVRRWFASVREHDGESEGRPRSE